MNEQEESVYLGAKASSVPSVNPTGVLSHR